MSCYRIARRLSAAAGVVEAFIGVQAETGRPVVVKRLVPPWNKEAAEFAARFTATGDAFQQVPGLTAWVELGNSREALWLVQELVDGEGLRNVLNALGAQKGFIAPNEGLGVVAQLAALVATLHAREEPLVHGDLCASTVLLTPAGDLLLTDAGLTRSLTRSPTSGPPRAEPFTIAPEQLAGGAQPATDVFRIGLLLYELAVGHPLFAAADAVQALVHCQRFTGVSAGEVAQVPEPWRSLLERMLAVEPAERPLAAEVDYVLRETTATQGWARPERDIARLVKRAFPDRATLTELAQGGGQELVLTPLGVRRASGPLPSATPGSGFGSLPTVPGPVMSSVHVSVLPQNDVPRALGATPTSPSGSHRALGDDSPSPSGSRRALAPAPTPGVLPPAPSAPPVPSAPPGQAVVGRITTRKMRASDVTRTDPILESRPSIPTPPPDPRAPRDAKVGAQLLAQGAITATQLQEATESVAIYGGTLADALQSMGAIDEDAIVAILSEATHTPHMTAAKLAELPVPGPEALQKVPLELARSLDLVPLALKGGGTQLMVAMKDPMDAGALERLKAATGLRSIIAMRAGENAIRRARNRFYGGEADDAPDWLERSAPRRYPTRPPFKASSLSGEVPVVAGALDPDPMPPLPMPQVPGRGPTLDAGGGRLVQALLTMLADRGQQALALSALAAGVARRLGASPLEAEQVRFAAVALCVANLLDGRPVHDVPGLSSLSGVLGESEWNAVEPLVSAWLSWPSDWPPGPSGQGLCLAFAFAAHAGNPRPRGSGLGSALASFRLQGGASRAHLEALLAELGAA